MSRRDSEEDSEEDEKPKRKVPNLRGSFAINLRRVIINVSDTQYPVVAEAGRDLGFKVQLDPEAGDWDLYFTDYDITSQLLFKMRPFQKINHFPGMCSVARKNLLAKNLNKMAKQFPQQYSFFPLTWQLPTEYAAFRTYYESVEKGKCRTYIVKPQALSQGKGIFLTRSIADVQTGAHYVVQRYLNNPLLIGNLKFDLRIYVLVAGSKPLRLYIYEEGLARLATEPYLPPSSENLGDVYRHLTNYAINKNNPKFVFNTSEKKMDVGHKRSLTSVYKYLADHGQNVQQIKQDIDAVIIKTMIAGLPQFQHQYNACQPDNLANNVCFQILGFDIMLTRGKDKEVRPWLIEVNHLPSFETNTPLDEFIKRNLLNDTFVLLNLTVQQKQRIFAEMREEASLRIYKKKVKTTVAQRLKQFQQAQARRDLYENSHLGRYRKIFPRQGYEEMLQYSKKNHQWNTKKQQVQEEKPTRARRTVKEQPPGPMVQSTPQQTSICNFKKLEQKLEQSVAESMSRLFVSKDDLVQLEREERERTFRIRSQKERVQKSVLPVSSSRQKMRLAEKSQRAFKSQLRGNHAGAGIFIVPKSYDMQIDLASECFQQKKRQFLAKKG